MQPGISVVGGTINSNIVMVNYGALQAINTNTQVYVKGSNVLIDSFAPTIAYESIAFTVTDNETYVINSNGILQKYNVGASTDFTVPLGSGLTIFNSVEDAGDLTIVIADKAALVNDNIKGINPDLANISGALTNPLPMTGVSGSSISWLSDTPAVVSHDGQTIVRPVVGTGNVSVNLTATITKGIETDTKVFSLTVLSVTLAEIKADAYAALTTALGAYTEGNYTVANWITLTGFKTAGDTGIDAAIDPTGVSLAQTTATNGMAGVKTILGALNDSKIAAATYIETEYTPASWLAITLALVLPEDSNVDKIAKEIAINAAISALVTQPIVNNTNSTSRSNNTDLYYFDLGSTKSTQETLESIESLAKIEEFTNITPPVEFRISCSYKGNTIDVNKFNSYVERTIAIPEGLDTSKITTGVIMDDEITVRHVPTKIIVINGKYYAQINSLTNSIYSVIWNPMTFEDAKQHWAKEAIDDMGSRLVISGVGNDMFEPDLDITRAEFAAIVVRALGLKPGDGNNRFIDVESAKWYSNYIETAYVYGIIAGYDQDHFGPTDKITREQAMVMVARAMKITKLEAGVTDSEIGALLSDFTDGDITSDYAKSDIAACVKMGIISGRSETRLAPKDNVTRAEVAVIIRRLLQESKLI